MLGRFRFVTFTMSFYLLVFNCQNWSRFLLPLSISAQSTTTYPTLVHFGAAQGLRRTVDACLRYCPTARQACALQNKDRMCPKELAEKYGHFELAEDLQDFEVTLPLLNVDYFLSRGHADVSRGRSSFFILRKRHVESRSKYTEGRLVDSSLPLPPRWHASYKTDMEVVWRIVTIAKLNC